MQPAWIHRIKKGDVLRMPSGRLRVVRYVNHSVTSKGVAHPVPRTTVIFSIAHCSWTSRCYTTYTGNDLVQMGYRPTKARVRLRSKLDRQIEEEFMRRGPASLCKLHCCDVIGIE